MQSSNNFSTISNGLRVRQQTYRQFSQPQVDYAAWALDLLNLNGNETILNIGASLGNYGELVQAKYPECQYHGIDLWQVPEADTAQTSITQAHIEQLPYPDQTFDVVMANHVMFFVENIHATLSEIRRVLKPSGVLMTTTNSQHSMPELQALMRRAIIVLGAAGRSQTPPPMPHHNYSLENGTLQLARHFFAVVRHDLPTQLIFPSADPIMAYIESTRPTREAFLPPEIIWEDVMSIMREQISVLINHFGELSINKISGVLIATESGGFIQDFVETKTNGAAPR